MIKQLIENGVHPAKAPMLAQLTNNLEEALKLNVDEWFAQAQKIVVKLYEVLKKIRWRQWLHCREIGFYTLKRKNRFNVV
jgi:hypothetical protein